MEINRKELLQALEIVKPGLANKELIEQSTSFAFIGKRVVTYNDEISISHPITGLELVGAIKADKLYALLNKIKKDEISLTITKNEVLISSGKSNAGLTLSTEIKLPLEEEITERGKWKPIPELFLKSMEFAVSSCSRAMSAPILTCVHVNKEGFVEASDNLRISRCELKEEMPIDTFLIPATSVVTMLRLAPTEIAQGKGWVHFRNPAKTIMSARLYEDSYPPTHKILHSKGERLVLPKTVNEGLERAGVFAKRDHVLDESVSITIADMQFKIRAEADSGWFEEKMNIKYKGTPISFSITPYLLKGILTETQDCYVSDTKLKFEGENWIYVSMLKSNKE